MTNTVEPRGAVKALLSYQQADEDGVMVIASRQAIHEVIDRLSAAEEENARLREALDNMPELVPTNWCDPLLSGPGSPFKKFIDGSSVEEFLRRLKIRVREAARNALNKESGDG